VDGKEEGAMRSLSYSADTAACGYPQKIPAQAELGRGTLAPSRVDLPPNQLAILTIKA